MGELIFNGFLLIFFAAMLVYSGQIEIWNGHVWARYWPMLILAVGVLLFSIKTWGGFLKLPKEELKFDIKIFGFKERNIQMLLVSFAWLIFYALILPKAGFIISTFIFCVGMQLLLRGKLGWQVFAVAFAITAAIYVVFVWGLGTSVPRGVGPLYDFGRWLEYLWS